MTDKSRLSLVCETCGWGNLFDQPHAYHAGFGNQGFLYNDKGDLTLVWSSFDPDYEAIVGPLHPWALDEKERATLESKLMAAPSGGAWRFSNPARCSSCGAPISGSIVQSIHFLVFPGSLVLDAVGGTRTLSSVLRSREL
jgi:hypothetical protein